MFRRCLRRLVDLLSNAFNGGNGKTKGHERELSSSSSATTNILQSSSSSSSTSESRDSLEDLSTISIGISKLGNPHMPGLDKAHDELRAPLTAQSSFEEEMRLKLLANYIDSPNTCQNIETECVMCLDEFSDENPMIPTLCACGESKSHFHYQCLYTWLEKSSKCPCCRQELYFQEM